MTVSELWFISTSIMKAMIIDAAKTAETLVNFYQTTWHYNPENSQLHMI
jgi:hypothetical protein